MLKRKVRDTRESRKGDWEKCECISWSNVGNEGKRDERSEDIEGA